MSFNSVKPQKGSEIVMQHLQKQIVSGVYPIGSRLPTVVDLAASFEVGRSTIREALSALKAMGYIDIRHGGGTFVNKELPIIEDSNGTRLHHQTESLREVIEARKYIETGCASLAAKRRTDEDLRGLLQIINTMKRSLGDKEQSELADVEFHLQIARASHNQLLINLMESLNQRIQESMSESRRLWFYSERATAERLLTEHITIYEAIKSKDDALASEKMMQHLSKVESVVQKFL